MLKAAILRKLVRGGRLAKLVFAAFALVSAVCASAANPAVHTDPLNYDPVVKDAYKHFYDLDYEGALSRFEQVRSAHPHDAIATDYVLNCILFRELYRQDLPTQRFMRMTAS